jgi:hypothetical protein
MPIEFWCNKTFRKVVDGYDCEWIATDGVGIDAAGKKFFWALPINQYPGHKNGYLRGARVFHEEDLPEINN